jgi:hypothetical protein
MKHGRRINTETTNKVDERHKKSDTAADIAQQKYKKRTESKTIRMNGPPVRFFPRPLASVISFSLREVAAQRKHEPESGVDGGFQRGQHLSRHKPEKETRFSEEIPGPRKTKQRRTIRTEKKTHNP